VQKVGSRLAIGHERLQDLSFGQDAFAQITQPPWGNDVDADLEEILKVRDEASQVEQVPSGLEFDKKVEIACLVIVSA
jgi:hypothetical protein